jgi:hypothetical protein
MIPDGARAMFAACEDRSRKSVSLIVVVSVALTSFTSVIVVLKIDLFQMDASTNVSGDKRGFQLLFNCFRQTARRISLSHRKLRNPSANVR